MSSESLAIFDQAWAHYLQTGNEAVLTTAARGHVGASRPLADLLSDYTSALDYGDTALAQAYAQELESVRTAHRVIEGHLPETRDSH